MGSYLGSIIEEKKVKNLDLAQKFFSFREVLGLRGKIVPPQIMAQSKKILVKS
jgi:hypothetical protein